MIVPVKMGKLVKVGAVQAEPVWLDLTGSVKTISLIKKAAASGVNVLGFPEVFIPGYPWYSPVQWHCSIEPVLIFVGASGRRACLKMSSSSIST
jgi:hypothetical protein